MNKELKNRLLIVFLSIALLVIAIILMLLPNSYITFTTRVNSEGGSARFYDSYNYVAIEPFGVGNITPMFTFVLTVASLIIFIIRAFKPQLLRTPSVIIPFVAFLISLVHLLFAGDVNVVTVQGILVSASLISVGGINILDTISNNSSAQ